MNGFWRRGFHVALGCTLAMLFIWGSVFLMNGSNASDNDQVSEAPSAIPTEVPTDTETVPPPADCLARFAQRDITDTKLNRFIGDGIDAKTADKSRQKLLTAVGHDASILRFYATQFGIDNLPSEAKMLTDDATCLSEAGRQVHHDLAVVLNASGVEFGDAPNNVYNSGVNDKGLPVIDTAPGIQGNKKALKVTLPDGSQVIMLVRCGNPVFEQPPDDFVPGPTDNPEPECEDCEPPPTCEDLGNCEPPPTEECPPGQTGTPPNCLEVKHPSEDPGPQGNAPEGGGHNDTNGPGEPNPEPTFPTQPHQNPPPPPPPAPSPTPSPTQPPEGGGSDGGQDNPPGDPGMP